MKTFSMAIVGTSATHRPGLVYARRVRNFWFGDLRKWGTGHLRNLGICHRIGATHIEKYGDARGLGTIKKRLPKRILGPVEGWETARLLTDDQAPVEQAWDLMALEYAK